MKVYRYFPTTKNWIILVVVPKYPYQKSHPKILQKSGKITIRQRAFGNCCFWGLRIDLFDVTTLGVFRESLKVGETRFVTWKRKRSRIGITIIGCFVNFLPCIHCTEQEQLLMEPWNPAQKGCKYSASTMPSASLSPSLGNQKNAVLQWYGWLS